MLKCRTWTALIEPFATSAAAFKISVSCLRRAPAHKSHITMSQRQYVIMSHHAHATLGLWDVGMSYQNDTAIYEATFLHHFLELLSEGLKKGLPDEKGMALSMEKRRKIKIWNIMKYKIWRKSAETFRWNPASCTALESAKFWSKFWTCSTSDAATLHKISQASTCQSQHAWLILFYRVLS